MGASGWPSYKQRKGATLDGHDLEGGFPTRSSSRDWHILKEGYMAQSSISFDSESTEQVCLFVYDEAYSVCKLIHIEMRQMGVFHRYVNVHSAAADFFFLSFIFSF